MLELAPRARSAARPGVIGRESDWYELGQLAIGGRLMIGDVSFLPSVEDCFVVDLPAATYRVRFAIADYGADWRVARLRVVSEDGASSDEVATGRRIGETWTDTGRTGLCDADALIAGWGPDVAASYARVQPWFEGDAAFGVAEFGPERGVLIPFVDSGFGDGEYPVRELTLRRMRCGVEVQFIRPGSRYPDFGV